MFHDVVTQFQARRPMLEHVAKALSEEINELLVDEHVGARVKFEVVSSEEFLSRLEHQASGYQAPLVEMPNQVCGEVEVREFEQIARVESLLGELLTVHSATWITSEVRRTPCRIFTCVIPPQAMPEGWGRRADVPTVFELKVSTADRPVKEDPVQLLTYPGDSIAYFPLIMKGGGIKGLAYVGAMEELFKFYSFNWFVGTSAGAITAVLLGAGYTPQELRELMKEKDFRDFLDGNWISAPFNLLLRGGVHPANTLVSWLDSLLAVKLRSPTRVRLSDLPHRVTLYASRRGKRTLKFDSFDNDADAAYAARCSMSIPLIFTAQADQGINTYDGGVHQNYPVKQLLEDHPNIPFIGLFLGPEVYEPVRQSVLPDLLSIWTEGVDAEMVSQYRDRTVMIDPRPIGTLQFDLSDEEKDYLLACGRAGALSHLGHGSAHHIEAKKARDELKSKIETARRAKQRRKWGRRAMMMLSASLIGAGLYAAYRFLL